MEFSFKNSDDPDLEGYSSYFLWNDVICANNLKEVLIYCRLCVTFSSFSEAHYKVNPPELSLKCGTQCDEPLSEWLAVIDKIYTHDGRICTVDTRNMKNSLSLLQHICQIALKHSRPIANLSLQGLCRTEAAIASCFLSYHSTSRKSIAGMCMRLDLSGNKLRDSQLSQILQVLQSENFVSILNVDGSDVGSASTAVLCDWLQSGICSLQEVSLGDTGVFALRPKAASSRTNAEKIAAAVGFLSKPIHRHIYSTKLKALHMGKVTNDGAGANVIGLLKGNTELRRLSLTGSSAALDLTAIHHLSAMLNDVTHKLEYLNISKCNLGNTDVATLCQALRCTSKCLSLDLSTNAFSDLTPLLPLLPRQLRSLDLSDNRFNRDDAHVFDSQNEYVTNETLTPVADEAMVASRRIAAQTIGLCRFLGQAARSRHLRQLRMDNCQIGASAIAVLFTQFAIIWNKAKDEHTSKTSVKSAPRDSYETLTHLSLNQNPLGKDGIAFMADVLIRFHQYHHLRYLGLRKTLGGVSYQKLLHFMQQDRHVGMLELSAADLQSADQSDMIAIQAREGEDAAYESSLLEYCQQPQPVVFWKPVALNVRFGLVSALRNQQTGQLCLPRDIIWYIFRFMRSPVHRVINVV